MQQLQRRSKQVRCLLHMPRQRHPVAHRPKFYILWVVWSSCALKRYTGIKTCIISLHRINAEHTASDALMQHSKILVLVGAGAAMHSLLTQTRMQNLQKKLLQHMLQPPLWMIYVNIEFISKSTKHKDWCTYIYIYVLV